MKLRTLAPLQSLAPRICQFRSEYLTKTLGTLDSPNPYIVTTSLELFVVSTEFAKVA